MAEQKSYLDTFVDSTKPESFNEETFVVVKDKSKQRKILLAGIAIVALLAALFIIFNLVNSVKMPNLAGMTLEEANAWATKNRIILAVTNVYDFNTDSGTVISQEITAGKSIAKNSTLAVKASLGADPDEAIIWPDIESMTTSEIETWISDNKLTGVKIVTANSDIVASGEVISYSLTDGTEDDFMRKSRATINVSIGPAAQSDTAVVSDFSTMKASEILQWGADNGVTITLTEAYNDYVAAGNIVSQSVKASTEILKTDPITVVISLGKEVVVPDFSSMTQDEANAWAKLNNVTATIQQRYSTTSNSKLISQGVEAGSSIKEGDELILTYSLGKVDVASYIGKTKLDILNWQKEVNTKDANITITFSEAYGSKGTAGKIISQSIADDFVSPGTTIKVVISKGMKILAPDFSGLTEDECSALAQSTGVAVQFDYQTNSSVGYGCVISQSPSKNIVITDADPITVIISISNISSTRIKVPDFRVMTKDEAKAWAQTNGITLTVKDQYSNNFSSGTLYGQSAASGSLIAKGSSIAVSCSLGKVAVSSFIGKTKLDMLSWLSEVNGKGAGITVKYTYANDKTYAMNVIVGQSIMNTYINTGSTITFNLSWDPTVTTS